METWRPIPGYENLYDVSDEGRVRSWLRRGKLLALGNSAGYRNVVLSRKSAKTTYNVHVLVMLAFIGPPPAKQECRHKNGIRYDNRLENLEYGTRRENRSDMVRHGSDRVKLTIEDVQNIRNAKLSAKEVKTIYGISLSNAYGIVRGDVWKGVQ